MPAALLQQSVGAASPGSVPPSPACGVHALPLPQFLSYQVQGSCRLRRWQTRRATAPRRRGACLVRASLAWLPAATLSAACTSLLDCHLAHIHTICRTLLSLHCSSNCSHRRRRHRLRQRRQRQAHRARLRGSGAGGHPDRGPAGEVLGFDSALWQLVSGRWSTGYLPRRRTRSDSASAALLPTWPCLRPAPPRTVAQVVRPRAQQARRGARRGGGAHQGGMRRPRRGGLLCR